MHLGPTYAEKWAAMAPIAGPASDVNVYPFDRLKGMPVMVCHGDADATVPVGSSRSMVAGMKAHGLTPVYIEVPGASHGSVVAVVWRAVRLARCIAAVVRESTMALSEVVRV